MKIPGLDIKEVGTVKEVKRGIVKVDGLPSCVYGQLIEFPRTMIKGMVVGFNPREVLAIIFGREQDISVGDTVGSSEDTISIPTGRGFLGRVVNSLGLPIDGKGNIRRHSQDTRRPVFQEASGVMDREPIDEPLFTGIKIIDLIIPIGKGQRELIIGDRQTGKSTIGLDTIINQKGKDIICIYCWIGGGVNSLKKHLQGLRQAGAMDWTVVVAAPAGSSAAEQYIVPYAAAALGEQFMYQGKDVLVIFDDLTKHAWVYRQMSLLLERSPGREAYPGDIFYLHSQLMERGGRLNKALGGGSMTFLPIVETLQGDISGYIPTNIISMTDGQIYISTALFREGFKPAIDLGLSVSRIGSKVQSAAIREVSEGLRLEYNQYRDMLRLTRLRTRLSQEAMEKMRRGDALRKLLVQPYGCPVSAEEEIVLFYAFKRKILQVISPDVLQGFIDGFFAYLQDNSPAIVRKLQEKKELDAEIKKDLDRVSVAFFRKIRN
ncbi:MAG: F0F1 ATP synthase subunit alpha [Candidatus Omnitrophota bacterium]